MRSARPTVSLRHLTINVPRCVLYLRTSTPARPQHPACGHWRRDAQLHVPTLPGARIHRSEMEVERHRETGGGHSTLSLTVDCSAECEVRVRHASRDEHISKLIHAPWRHRHTRTVAWSGRPCGVARAARGSRARARGRWRCRCGSHGLDSRPGRHRRSSLLLSHARSRKAASLGSTAVVARRSARR